MRYLVSRAGLPKFVCDTQELAEKTAGRVALQALKDGRSFSESLVSIQEVAEVKENDYQ